MSRLGTSDYAVQITTRGGATILGEIEWDTISCTRPANDTGDATVRWNQDDAVIPAFLVDCEPWQHDLVVWRADEPDPVFAGPVRTCTYDDGLVEVAARDGTTWFSRRRNRTDAAFDGDLAAIWGHIAAEALAQDPSPNLQIITAPCGVTGTRVTRAAERAMTADLLAELSRSGVDWCVLGRRILIGGPTMSDALGPLVLTDEAVRGLRLVKAGDVTTTRETVRWQTTDQMPELTTVDSHRAEQFGLLETLDEEADIADAVSAAKAAQARIDLLSNNPRTRTVTLTADAPALVAELVPGRLVDFRATTLPTLSAGTARLQKVTISVGPDDEAVTLDTTPLGVV